MKPYLLSLAIAAVFVVPGCGEQEAPFDAAAALEKEVYGERALSHVAALVAMGPRPAGSEALEKCRSHLEKELAASGWVTRRQTFEARTPDGQVEFTNLRARFGESAWSEKASGLLCTHYDTKRYEGFEFVGANDGSSGTGLLLELANILAIRPDLASRLELVFFDGEEAFGTSITATDGLYGSKHYAATWLTEKEASRPDWGLLLDMVGDADLNIRAAILIPRSSVRELAQAGTEGRSPVDIIAVERRNQEIARDLLAAAADLDLREFIGISSDYIIDDHIPLNVIAGIPTIDLIDFDYPHWHTPADTLDKLSAGSLEITGRVTLLLLEKYLLAR